VAVTVTMTEKDTVTMMETEVAVDIAITMARVIVKMVVAMAVAVMVYTTFVLPYSHCLIDLLVVTALLELAGPGANLVYIFAGGFLHGLFQRHARLIDTIMAILLAGCAVYLLIS
jgi:hypothetical protein